jgi:hypothetical protein
MGDDDGESLLDIVMGVMVAVLEDVPFGWWTIIIIVGLIFLLVCYR